MGRYLVRRILQAIPLLILVNVLIFVIIKLAGDPFAYLAIDPAISEEDRAFFRRSLGLDDPLPLQFVHWYLGDDWYQRDLDFDGEPETYGQRAGILRGDLGQSIRFRRPVDEVIGNYLPNTLILGFTALAVTITTGVSIGVFAALRQYSVWDNVITSLSFLTFSMPIFLVALLLVLFFAVIPDRLGLPHLPPFGMCEAGGDCSIDEVLPRLVLPVIALSAIQIAAYARFVRASMLEVINSDYVRTARAKGLNERRITFLHTFKNAALPLIALIALDIPIFLAGAVVTESIFQWPGMGTLFIQSLRTLDPPVLQIFTLMTAFAVVIFQILADLVYAWVDPRIRYN